MAEYCSTGQSPQRAVVLMEEEEEEEEEDICIKQDSGMHETNIKAKTWQEVIEPYLILYHHYQRETENHEIISRQPPHQPRFKRETSQI